VSQESGVRSGALYPILHRMLDEGWLEDGWESFDADAKRPPRRYYTLTDLGRAELAKLLAAAPIPVGTKPARRAPKTSLRPRRA
jgi:PadR family transcriptional regulator